MSRDYSQWALEIMGRVHEQLDDMFTYAQIEQRSVHDLIRFLIGHDGDALTIYRGLKADAFSPDQIMHLVVVVKEVLDENGVLEQARARLLSGIILT